MATKLTHVEIESIIEYLTRVVPRGNDDADYLYALLAKLRQIVAAR